MEEGLPERKRQFKLNGPLFWFGIFPDKRTGLGPAGSPAGDPDIGGLQMADGGDDPGDKLGSGGQDPKEEPTAPSVSKPGEQSQLPFSEPVVHPDVTSRRDQGTSADKTSEENAQT